MKSKSDLASEKKRAEKIFSLLRKEYPVLKPALDFKTAFQLLIATILSAQCTDARVNIVTKDLFKKYKTPQDYLMFLLKNLKKIFIQQDFIDKKQKV